MSERKTGPVIFGIEPTHDGAAAVAIGRMGNFGQAHKDVALEMSIAGLISDARRSLPVDYVGAGPKRDTLPPLPPGNGWRDRGPLEMPGGATAQRAIERMCDEMLGPGAPAARERRGAGAEAILRKAVAEARAQIAAAREAEPEEPVAEEQDYSRAESCVAEVESAPVPVAAESALAEPVALAAAPKAGTLTRRRLA